MKTFYTSFLLLFLFVNPLIAQERPIEIEDEQNNNRLYLYAVNKNLQDFDVIINVTGTGFRQRAGKPRAVRVPARSRVEVSSLIIERGQEPKYKYTLEVSEELSRRAMIREAELIRIQPKWPLTVYKPALCTANCDSLISSLDQSPYLYTLTEIEAYPKVREQLSRLIVGGEERLAEIDTPIIMMGGKMYLTLTSYDEVMSTMQELE
ncbi:MAG TPA: hypothetical protein DCZ44_00990 [Flavobacteriaceae bacterium]|nr:hypothetical protein [Flavobacteriaceae bacterium]